ncbi:hypothetical protein [Taibaiella koreensis]|uniref:hypothetical protein n=1 Tax=Taibaiella koreensis TaxID=1268548 RepID=UPI000E599CCE|nr:hypothetical protein [Taibaiella koreensis]
MKSFTYILFPLFFLALAANAQDETNTPDGDEYVNYRQHNTFRLLEHPRTQTGIHGVTTPFMKQQSFGASVDMQTWYTEDLSVGLSFTITGRKVTPSFGYAIGQPLLTYYDISLFNEFKVQQWGRLQAAVRLYTGFAAFHLADNSIQVPYTWYDENGFAYEGERALSIDNNYFMRVAPAFVLRYSITPGIQIEGSAAYNFFIGNAHFGSSKDFNNYMAQLGVRVDIN